ncbi:patatin-like protein [Burkholderia sp. NLJ2]|uniref:patatin-like protein n=1 Tax=Burkholderia sp. NLJ2 TaxID=3090699 RepID=UPI003C6C8755
MSNEAVEELRLALVMNGGISLAVWMGGVTNEIHRIVTRSHPVYAALLDMTRTTARVDVISGTSAGGINGAALAIALAYGGRFAQLRDVWKEIGAFDRLLRPPLARNPGSLLMGDDYFLPELTKAFQSLAHGTGTPVDAPLDLYLTTTLLQGRPACTVDDLGSQVGDVDHRARFHFVRSPRRDDFREADPLLAALSRAARSTASFPLAFEPSRIETDDIAGHPTFVDVAGEPLDTPRYVIDGGVLDNKPFDGALQSIFSMPAERGVRRVLAYINPDPGNGTRDASDASPPDAAGDMPPLGSVLASSVWSIPQSQTIADQLAAIQRHNHTVRERRNDVLDLVRSRSAPELEDLATQLFDLYRKRRIANTFESFVYSSFPAAAAGNPAASAGQQLIGKHGKEAMRIMFGKIAWDQWIPPAWPQASTNDAFERSSQWAWGLAPVDFAAKVLLDMLRLMQRFHALIALRESEDAPLADTPNVDQPCDDWSDPDVPVSPPHLSTERQENESSNLLTSLWQDAYHEVTAVTRFRHAEESRWKSHAQTLLATIGKRAGPAARKKMEQPEAKQAMPDSTLFAPDDLEAMLAFVTTPLRRARCARIVHRIASIICEAGDLAKLILSELDALELNAADTERALGLRRLVEFLAPERTPRFLLSRTRQAPDNVRRGTLFRLMQLEVIQYAFNDRDALSEDSLIELVQISGNASSPLAPDRADAHKKLLGLQLAHFGGFYKKSWRINDWIYGRLDGAERLVKVLLNPERLQYVYANRPDAARLAAQDIRRIAVDSAPSSVLRNVLDKAWQRNGCRELIATELVFLDHPDSSPPDMLRACADAITLRLHYGILQEELDVLSQAITEDVSDGAEDLGPGRTIHQIWAPPAPRRRIPTPPPRHTPQAAEACLRLGLLADESLPTEAGSDLFTRTMSHTAAALQSTLASKGAKLGPISALFASLRVPILGFYFVVQGLLHRSRTSAALNGALLAVGFAIVVLQFAWSQQELGDAARLPHAIVLLGWALFAYGIVLSMLRTPMLFVALLLVVALGVFTAMPGALIWAIAILVFALALSLSPPVSVAAVDDRDRSDRVRRPAGKRSVRRRQGSGIEQVARRAVHARTRRVDLARRPAGHADASGSRKMRRSPARDARRLSNVRAADGRCRAGGVGLLERAGCRA